MTTERIQALEEALREMCEEFRGYDLPYGSKAYHKATSVLATSQFVTTLPQDQFDAFAAAVEKTEGQPLTVQDAAQMVADAINNDMQTFNKALASIPVRSEMPVRHFFAEAILAYAAALRAIAEGRA